MTVSHLSNSFKTIENLYKEHLTASVLPILYPQYDVDFGNLNNNYHQFWRFSLKGIGLRISKISYFKFLFVWLLACLVAWDVLCHSVTWMNISELDEYFGTKPFVNDPWRPWLHIEPIWGSWSPFLESGTSSKVKEVFLTDDLYVTVYISELDEYFCTKPFANDSSCLWLSVGGSAPGWGFTSAWGSVPD